MWWALGAIALVLAGYLAYRLTTRRTLSRMLVALAQFIEAANQTRDDETRCAAVHRRVVTSLQERTTPDYLRHVFHGHITGHHIGAMQITRNLTRGSQFTAAAKLFVQLTFSDDTTADYVVVMAREGKVWKVNDFMKGADYTMIDVAFE